MNNLRTFPPFRMIAVVIFVLGLNAGAAVGISGQLVAGSIDIAQRKLAVRRDDRAGFDLLLFALAVSPENREALLLQAKLERGLPIRPPESADSSKTFLTFLDTLAKRTPSTERQLLLYKVIEIVDPMNETALLELTKAKNQGTDVSFESLIKCLNPERGQTAPGQLPPAAGTLPTAATVSAQKLQEAVDNLKISRDISRGGIMRVLSYIDSAALRPVGGILEYRSTRYPAQIYSSSGSTIYYSRPSGLGYGHEFHRAVLPVSGIGGEDVGALDWLRELTAVYNLEMSFTDRSLLIADAVGETGLSNGLEAIDVNVLCQERDKGMVDFIRRYRGRKILVKGRFSGMGRAMKDYYVEMESGKVRVLLDGGVEPWRIDRLKEREYQGWTVYALAECDGFSGGRIVLKKCRFVGW